MQRDAEWHVTFTEPFTVTGRLRAGLAAVKRFDDPGEVPTGTGNRAVEKPSPVV
jgi:hypothetical protein